MPSTTPAALLKAAIRAALGIWMLGWAAWNAYAGTMPEAAFKGYVDLAALVAITAAFGALWRFRSADSKMRGAWICSRNDVVGNVAVLAAAFGVFGAGTGWPDIVVAVVMSGLALHGAATVMRQALNKRNSLQADPAE